jgi:simple sugar transport system permease protein
MVAQEGVMSLVPFDLLTPLLVAALGALWSERAGVLNIALEGQMLSGALVGVLALQFTGDLTLTLFIVLVFGALTGLLLAWGTLELGSDPFIAALGLNLLLPALAGWVSFLLYGNLGVIRLTHSEVPQLLGFPIFFLLALGLTAATHAVLFHTPWGLRLRAAGTSPALMASRGLETKTHQRQALALSGALGALSGAFLALTLGAFVPGISAGKGWIALVALYLGLRRPWPLLVACLVLAWTDQASNLLQSVRDLPAGLVLGLPSLLTVMVFVATSAARKKSQLKSVKLISR